MESIIDKADKADKPLDPSTWWAPPLTEIPSSTREILEDYAHIPAGEVLDHVERIRKHAFAIIPYPCIGQNRYLTTFLASHPTYPTVLSKLRAGGQFVDVGACVGSNIRRLILDGVPASQIYGVEMERGFIETGYDLFRDREKLPSGCFMAEDMTDPALNEVAGLEGQMDVVFMSSFYHLFDLADQVVVTRKVMRLVRRSVGSLVIGRHIGNARPGPGPGTKGGGLGYMHNAASFAALVNLVAAETATKWEVTCSLDDRDFDFASADSQKVGKFPWVDENRQRLVFTARVVEVEER